MSQVRIYTLVFVTKAGQNRMQHVWDIGMLTGEGEGEEEEEAG